MCWRKGGSWVIESGVPVIPALWRERALTTIERNVREYRGHAIVQPSPTYEGFWARDTMIILLGLIDAGRTDQVGELLRTWAAYQIGADDDPHMYVLLNKHRLNWSDEEVETPGEAWLVENRGGLPTCVYVGRDEYPDDTREIYSCHPDPDSTAWWLVACARYVEATGDGALAGDLRAHLQGAMDMLVRRDSDGDGLVEQCPNEDWADHMRRHGKVTYTQTVWYGAACAARSLGISGPQLEPLREAIRRTVFRRNGVLDWRCARAESSRVAQDSSLLVLFGVIDREEATWLLQRLELLDSPHGHRVVAPTFQSSRMGPYHFKRGEYQNGGIWTWLTGWEAQARAVQGDRAGAYRLLDTCFCRGCERIYEWIDPVRGHRYNPDFATGAGSILSGMARLQESYSELRDSF
jgi:glycogen debranching enzyme